MRTWIVSILLILLIASSVQAQSFRYIDESGNIHWADSLSQIPPRYRNQVLAPTPVPTGKARARPLLRPTPKPRPTKTPRKTPTPKATRTPTPQNQQKSIFGGRSAPQQTPAPQAGSQIIVPPTPVPNLDSLDSAPKAAPTATIAAS